uniref:Gustatory receptor n=1 Tax=Tetranychus urticae TaxID=32264 RepID=T1L4Z7_TETUR
MLKSPSFEVSPLSKSKVESLITILVKYLFQVFVSITNNNQIVYPLSRLFKMNCLRIIYIQNGFYIKYSFSWFMYIVSLPIMIFGTIRCFSLLLYNKNPFYSKILGDFSYHMGKASFWFLACCFGWFSAAIISRCLLEFSNYRKNLQHWIKPLFYLENPYLSSDIKTRNASHLTQILLTFNLVAGAFCAASIHLPIIIRSQHEWLPYTLILTFTAGIQGYLIGSYEINFTVLNAFYLYIYGRKFALLGENAISVAYSTRSECCEHFTSSMERFTSRLTLLAQHMYKINQLMEKTISTIFVATFIAEAICLYCMFFVHLNGSTKYIIQILGILTILYGQLIYFISGTYAQHKFDGCIAQLQYLNEFKATQMPLSLRFKALVTTEYLTGRKLFRILASIDTCTMNLIKIQVEIAMLLLMLIANAKR